MIIEVFIPQGQAENTLPQQLFEAMLDAARIASIHEAIGETAKDAKLLIELLKHQHTGIAAQMSAVEISGQNLTSKGLATRRDWAYSVSSRAAPLRDS